MESGDPARSGVDDISLRVASVERYLAGRAPAIDASVGREAEDRSWIARAILWVFVGTILAILALLLVDGVMTKEWGIVTERAADLIKTAVLPVVTLVLGFYFGSRSGKG